MTLGNANSFYRDSKTIGKDFDHTSIRLISFGLLTDRDLKALGRQFFH